VSAKVSVEEVRGDLTPEAVAVAGFKAGWRAACCAMADALEGDAAPAGVVRGIREAAGKAPAPSVAVSLVGFERGDA
jgi:hypothetical protein